MVQLQQRLIFSGECENAIDLYVSAFDADIRSLVRYAELRGPHPPQLSQKIASAELDILGTVLHLADGFESSLRPEPPTAGIALVLPETSLRQAVTVLTGTRWSWWSGDAAPPGAAAPVEVVDPYGVLWLLGGYSPAAA